MKPKFSMQYVLVAPFKSVEDLEDFISGWGITVLRREVHNGGVAPLHSPVGGSRTRRKKPLSDGRLFRNLKDEEIVAVYKSTDPSSVIAERFNITETTVRSVKAGKYASHRRALVKAGLIKPPK